ncbi:MAG: carboxyl transferase domain-containing protein, partial [Betaproteobacteria bacterium]
MNVTGPHPAPSGASPASRAMRAPVRGTVVAIEAVPGQACRAGQTLVVLESMKMEVPLACEIDAEVLELMCSLGEVVEEGAVLLTWRLAGQAGGAKTQGPAQEPQQQALQQQAPALRPDLARLQARRALLDDAARPEAMARRHAGGLRSARENVADLLDAGSFSEMGAFAVAAQRSRRSEDDLQRHTPADGLITGTGTVDGRPCAIMAYDYTVLAGTQGAWNHAKSDRLLEVARRSRLPLVLFAEGGGGRPGDVDWPGVAGLDCTTFASLAAFSGQVPLVGIAAGRCFAGNAALLGCCDLIIAVEGASIGLGGPAMIEGGGLGRVEPDAVGPVDVHWTNGVVDVRVPDEAAAVAVARRWLGLVADAAVAYAKSVS